MAGQATPQLSLSLWQQATTPAGRSNFWRKYRRTILIGAGVIGVGAVGVGGYYYWCHRNEWREREELQRLQQEVEERKRVEELEKAREEEEAARADAQLESHFESIQVIADATTLPSVLPHLKSRLLLLIDLSPLTDALVSSRSRSGEGRLSNPQKMQIWEDLKILSFTRALGGIWAVALLFLFVRIQLNILGRHVYIHTAAEEPAKNGAKEEAKEAEQEQEQLSMSCQHKFIAFSDYLPHLGLMALLQDMQESVAKALQMRSLKDRYNLEQLKTLMSDLRHEFEASHSSKWHQYLLPAHNVLPDDLAVASSAADVAKAGFSSPRGKKASEEPEEDQAVRGAAIASAVAGGYQKANQEASDNGGASAKSGDDGSSVASSTKSGPSRPKRTSAGGSKASSDDAALDDLMTETRLVLYSSAFKDALRIAVDSIINSALDELAYSAFMAQTGSDSPSNVGQQGPLAPVPLAKLLPPVAAVATSLLDEGFDENRYLQNLASVPELAGFSARVYAGSVSGRISS